MTTRYLGPDGYGRVALALSVTQLLAVLADAGLTMIVMRELAQRPDRAAVVVGSVLVLRGGLGLAALAAAVLAAFALPYPPDVRLAIVIAGAPLVLGVLTSGLTAVLLAGLRGARVATADVLGRASALVAVTAVVALDLGFYAVVATAAVGAAVSLTVTAVLTRPFLGGRRLRPDPAVARGLLVAALPVGAAQAFNEAYFRADAVIISLSRPYEELGGYALAWRVSELVAVFPGVLLVSVFPLLSSYISHLDRGRAAAARLSGGLRRAVRLRARPGGRRRSRSR